MSEPFRHVDRDQTILFGAGALESADELLGEGYTLLTTPRAAGSTPAVTERAAKIVNVPAGPVDEIAAALRSDVGPGPLVALGGGRVIDTAKAIAAADARTGPVAIPTSLSGAEMTGVHRHARGVPNDTPRSRASAVINDPALSASQPVDQLAASSANALGRALTAVASRRTTPLARVVAVQAVETLAGGWAADEPDREKIALGALLAGWAVDRSGLGPHHALAQTAVRLGSLKHATANAALLPFTIAAIRTRESSHFDALDAAIGRPLEAFADELRLRSEVTGLGADDELLGQMVDAALKRPELARVAPALERDDVQHIYRSAS